MNQPTRPRSPDWGKYPPWVQYVPGLVGGAWLIGGFSWVLWARIVPGNLSMAAKVAQSGICVAGIAFAVSVLWPFKGQSQVKSGDIGDFWSFLKATPPAQEPLRSLHRKFRRSAAYFGVMLLFMVAWGVIATAGLAGPD